MNLKTTSGAKLEIQDWSLCLKTQPESQIDLQCFKHSLKPQPETKPEIYKPCGLHLKLKPGMSASLKSGPLPEGPCWHGEGSPAGPEGKRPEAPRDVKGTARRPL